MSFERMRCSFSLSLTDPRMRRHAHLARPLAVYHFDMNLAWPFLMSDIASREERERVGAVEARIRVTTRCTPLGIFQLPGFGILVTAKVHGPERAHPTSCGECGGKLPQRHTRDDLSRRDQPIAISTSGSTLTCLQTAAPSKRQASGPAIPVRSLSSPANRHWMQGYRHCKFGLSLDQTLTW
jgi:hypothetical protein